ncbi:MAG: hypothetical protein DMF61_06660 [Blastocatellia bacterium AA13]|nr:MAG: hypothetical protein DMF61_06660 [Blastocatellia bacterium AA13]
MLEHDSNSDLRAYVVWVPKVGAREPDVDAATRLVADRRALHYWDEEGLLLRSYRPALGITKDAWDVYMVYGPAARWEGEAPPQPEYWMHQLNVKNAPELDGKQLLSKISSIESK